MRKAIDSKLQAGAEACRAMLISIEALSSLVIRPASESDADVKAAHAGQYVAADRAVSIALDQHGNSAGFRTVLAAYLLTVAGGNIPAVGQMTAEALLTDGGYRAMPSEPDEDAEGLDIEDEGFRLDRFLALLLWIEHARALTDNVAFLSANYADFREVAQRHKLACADAQWEDDVSDGLRMLISDATVKARRITEAGMALEQQKRGSRG